MHIKVFDKISLGNLIEKRKKDKPGTEDGPAIELTEIEAVKKDKSKGKEKPAKPPKHPTPEAVIALVSDIVPVRPHGPAAEVTLDDEDLKKTDSITLDEIDDSAKPGEDVKIAEVTAAQVAAAQ